MTGLIVAGMHRSGTSLITRLLVDGGWHPGEEVLSSETEEYLEDASFVAIHRDWLSRSLPAGDGHRDWGLSSEGPPDPSSLPDAESTIRLFCTRRSRQRERWVAKDPRASLFLDQWANHSDVRFILVYRAVWDAVESAIRLGHGPFCADPSQLRRAWLQYNRGLLDFAVRRRGRCTVVSAESLAADPASTWAVLAKAVGMSGAPDPAVVDPDRMRTRHRTHPIAGLTTLLHPECADVLERLDAIADVPRPAAPADETGGSGSSGRPRLLPGGSLPPSTGLQIVIPCRDDGAFLDEAIASAEHACSEAAELTVVNDGSSDAETTRILDLLRGAGYQVLTTEGVGLAGARNVGCSVSHTLAVLPLDADNRVLPALVASMGLIESGRFDVLHGSWEEFGMRRRVVRPPEASFDTLLPFNNIDACALVRRQLVDDLHGYDAELPYLEDWDLWLRSLAAGARFGRLDDVTFQYLVRPGSLNSAMWADEVVREATVRRILDRMPAQMGTHGASAVLRLMAATHRVDQLEKLATTAGAPPSSTQLAAELAAIRSRRSYRAIERATRALARRPRLRARFLRLSGRR